MNSDFTQQQSLGGLAKAEHLSRQSTVPPADVQGYSIEKLLGQGAYGQVWLGRDLNTGRQVAIKFYLYRGGVNWNLLSREVQHLVNMSTGRYIVQVLGVGWEAEPPYYVMEFLENGSLEDRVREKGSLSIAETVSMLREIAEGLSFAHGRGVLHCDLKPANVMLDHDMRPRLADFGQSRMSNEQTPSLGTLFFMAPEQADLTASPDVTWDVYALGAIAYSMLVGSPPYRTPEVVETLDTAQSLPERLRQYRDTIRHSPKPRLHYRRRGIDKGLCQIVDRCLAYDPRNRFANVQQVIGAIDVRDRARARRPLYVMGIVGPILFLVLMMLFSARSIGVAKQESLQQVQQLALESNQLTSTFAARTLEGKIVLLFRSIEAEAERGELRAKVAALRTAAAPLLEVIADGEPHASQLEALRSLPEQDSLHEYMVSRLNSLIMLEENGSSAAIFNSLFVTDPRGTNLATDFADSQSSLAQSPVGRNFAYRSYFNGLGVDGSSSTPRDGYSATDHTHLSAAFRSTSTGKWKVGISTPVWPDGDEGQSEPIGVLVMTINLGDFELLVGSNTHEKEVRFAALVDGRAGNGAGTLLQHPLLRQFENTGNSKSLVPQIDANLFSRLTSNKGVVDYVDPAAKFAGGERFEGEWIAAMKQVSLPTVRKRTTSNTGSEADSTSSTNSINSVAPQVRGPAKSDLWVLVQERRSSIAAPVTRLGAMLERESYFELFSLVCAILLLWFVVYRIGQTPASATTGMPANPDTAAYKSTIDTRG